MKYSFSLLLFLLCLFVGGQESKQLSWDDLIPKNSAAFDDPFERLNSEQLQNLSFIARIETLEKHRPESVNEASKAERDSLRILLATQNVPVDSLFAIRYEIADKRRKRAEEVVTGFNGTKVKMPGYLLPLDYSNKAVTKFLLVPWVGACIHTPPPPKNQIVYVELKEGYEVKSRFEAVWISGEMQAKSSSTELFLVDGSDDIDSGYSITNGFAEPYKK